MHFDQECGTKGADDCSLHGCTSDKNGYDVYYRDGMHYGTVLLCQRGVSFWAKKGWQLSAIPVEPKAQIKQEQVDGHWCASCQTFVRQSEPNQENGSFICFSCRTYPYYGNIIK